MIKQGSPIETPLGAGVVVGVDLPDSDLWRYIVRLENNVFEKEKNEYCFFPREVKACGGPSDTDRGRGNA